MKRFYKEVSFAEADGGWRVLLDGRAIKTAGGRAQIVPTRALAEAMADEWARQGEEIDPTTFFYRDMADYTLDVITPQRASVIDELLPYAETDTLCYRADPDAALWQRQIEVWEPLLSDVEARLGVTFRRISGIMHRPQPAETLARLAEDLAVADAFALAALKNLSSLAASLIIALEALREGADIDALWQAANLEEDWQAELWGKDAEAEALRLRRASTFAAAVRFAALARA